MEGLGGETFITETQPQFAYDDIVEQTQSDLAILIAGVTETSQSTLLLKKKKEMREVDDALEFMKEEFRKRMEMCEKRQRKFEEKQAEMKGMVARFQQFIQDNDAKRGRAEAKALTESQTCARLEKEARAHKATLGQLQSERGELEVRLSGLSRYSSYLDSIVAASEGEYDEIQDLLMRYKTLKLANADLHAQSETNTKKVAGLRADLASLKRKSQNLSLTMSSESQQCGKRVEELSAEAAVLDVASEHTDGLIRDREAETGQIMSAIQYLYTRCWSSMRAQPKLLVNKSKTTVGALDYLSECLELVARRMKNLVEITAQYGVYLEQKAKKDAAKARASREAAAAAGGKTGYSHHGDAESGVGASGLGSRGAGTASVASSGLGYDSVASAR